MPPDFNSLPEAVIRKRKRVSFIWIVPLVATLVGGWMMATTLYNRGPLITISFSNAQGLVAGKTSIRFKDVDVGTVERITLSDDLSEVLVEARMQKAVKQHLTEGTRFWVERAQVSAGEVSGLQTLLSGAYIGMEPGGGSELVTSFPGEDVRPVITSGLPGKHFLLTAEGLGSLSIRSPVYHRQIQVGEVVSYALQEEQNSVHLKIFINAPYDKLVTTGTRFWNASGIALSLDSRGLEIDAESLISILSGGIAFETPKSLKAVEPANEDQLFTLFPSHEASQEASYRTKSYYLLYFNESLRGLESGADIEFRGIKVGEVIDYNLRFNAETLDFRIPVLIAVEPERFEMEGDLENGGPPLIDRLVERGLRAQMKTGNLLTGRSFIDLDFYPKAPRVSVNYQDNYPVIPTVPADLQELIEGLKGFVTRLNKVPVDRIGNNLDVTIAQLNKTLEQFDKQTLPELTQTLEAVKEAADSLKGGVGERSPFNHELRKTLRELEGAARALKILADYLERHPESLLFGKGD